MKYLNIQDHVTLGAIPPGVHHSEEYLHTPGLVGVIQWVSDHLTSFSFGQFQFWKLIPNHIPQGFKH